MQERPQQARSLRSNSIAIDYSNEQYVNDVTIDWLYTPHSLTALALCSLGLIAAALQGHEDTDAQAALARGLLAASFVFIVLGLMIFPSGPFIRPNPAIWRVVFGISVLYLFALIVLLFMDVHTARWAMTFFDKSLNVKARERHYAEDCSLTWRNVIDATFDRFVAAHFFGWMAKSLLLRNRLACWVASVTWELVEIAFTHMLPNFAECWWDQIILDIIICNGLGIEIGFRLCKYLEVQKYEWTGVGETQTMTGKAKRIMMQMSPHSWTTVKWELTRNWRRFMTLQLLLITWQIKDLNSFFLKNLLWIPSEHPLNLYRLILLFFIGLPSLRQIYIYSTDEKCTRLGSQAWVLSLIVVVEALITFKFGQNLFMTRVAPPHVKYMWCVLVPCYILFCIAYVVKIKKTAALAANAALVVDQSAKKKE